MYHLARSLYLHFTSKEEYSILLLGLDNAGKTTLLSQIKSLFSTTSEGGTTGDAAPSSAAGNTVPTVGQNVAVVNLPDMYLKIWDVGGQLSLRKLWTTYYKAAHAVVFVVDSSDLGTGAELEDDSWLGQKKREGDVKSPITPMTPWSDKGRLEECRQVLESVLGHEDMAGIPILVLANKQDREDCVEVVRIKEGFVRKVFEGEKGGMVRDSRVLPVSALNGTGVREAVEWVKSRVVWNKEGRPPVMR
jgi:ADP-ribosylation factor related protein 1